MSTVNITLSLDEVDTVREALAALINKYSEWAEEAYNEGKDKLAEVFEEEARTTCLLMTNKFYVEQKEGENETIQLLQQVRYDFRG